MGRESVRLWVLPPAEDHHLEMPDGSALPSEDLILLQRFIDGLGAFGKVLVLLYLDGYSHQEIGDVLGIAPGYAAAKIGRLKARLHQSASR